MTTFNPVLQKTHIKNIFLQQDMTQVLREDTFTVRVRIHSGQVSSGEFWLYLSREIMQVNITRCSISTIKHNG